MLIDFLEKLRRHLVKEGEMSADMMTAVLDVEPDYTEGLIVDLREMMSSKRKELESELQGLGFTLSGPAPYSTLALADVYVHRLI